MGFGNGHVTPSAITTDASGNIYLAGSYNLATWNIGGVSLINSFVGFEELFVLKYNSSGILQWGKSFGDYDHEYMRGIAVDPSGNVYITGFYTDDSVKLGTFSFANPDFVNQIFVAKLNSSGTIVWAKEMGGVYDSEPTGMVADATGNIYVTGSFEGTGTFGSIVLSNFSNGDGFLAKMNSSGTVLWAKSFASPYSDNAESISIDPAGNVALTGRFYNSTISFGSVSLTATANCTFVCKYDASGNLLWAKKVGAGTSASSNSGFSVASDASGNIYVGGDFSGNLQVGSTTLNGPTSPGYGSAYVIKYNSSGTELWAKKIGGNGIDFAKYAAITPAGNLIVAGVFSGSNTTIGTTTLTNSNTNNTMDAYVAQYDASGNVTWVKKIGGTGSENEIHIAVSSSGNLFVNGTFTSSPLAFGTTNLTNMGNTDWDVYFAKMSLPVGIDEMLEKLSFRMAPNPFSERTFLSFPEELHNADITVYDILGNEVRKSSFSGNSIVIERASLNHGIYFVSVKDDAHSFQNRRLIIE